MILLGGTLLQPLVAHPVQDEPRRIGHDDDASRLLGHLPELLCEEGGERPKRMLEPASEHLGLVGLDRGQRVGRIEAGGERAPPRVDHRRSQSCRGPGWKLRAERAVGEQTLPTPLQLSSAPQQIRPRSEGHPLRRHGSASIFLSTVLDFRERGPSSSERFDHFPAAGRQILPASHDDDSG
jgi:hypothetical protein